MGTSNVFSEGATIFIFSLLPLTQLGDGSFFLLFSFLGRFFCCCCALFSMPCSLAFETAT